MRIFWCKMLSEDVKLFTHLRETLSADELTAHLTFCASTEQPELCLHTEETNLNTNSDKYAAKIET